MPVFDERKEQIAVCDSVESVSTVKGVKEVYHMILNGKEFKLWQSSFFKALPGQEFRPVVSIVPRGYLDKSGKPRGENQAVVDWEAV